MNAGVIVWYVDHEVTRYIPIAELHRLYDNDVKSLRYDDDNFRHIDIFGKKKRVFFDYYMERFFSDLYRRYDDGTI